mmetsp:Transcript_43941/g.81257  ORF Transcript_43941/g.81257 Transcript_43941/m.81257 type:complete len:113 (-) Transcript_43941:1080-1418(-)
MPCAHLCDAAPSMLATHRRNLDEDAAGLQELQHAPKTSDKIESCFAVLDRTRVLGASTHALFGVASANLLKAFQSPAAKKKNKPRPMSRSGSAKTAVPEVRPRWDSSLLLGT